MTVTNKKGTTNQDRRTVERRTREEIAEHTISKTKEAESEDVRVGGDSERGDRHWQKSINSTYTTIMHMMEMYGHSVY